MDILSRAVTTPTLDTAEDWYNYLKRLALDFQHRKEIGEEAFKTIQDYTIQGNIHRYAEFFKKVITTCQTFRGMV